MSQRYLGKLFVLALLPGAFGCSLFESESGPARVEDLLGLVEQVYVDAEVAKVSVQTATDKLRMIVDSEFKGDPVKAYEEYVELVDRSHERAEKLHDSYERMQKGAAPVFEAWEENLRSFSNEELRKRSRARYDATRGRYDTIVAVVEPALREYDAINKGLKDHALFLASDFNAGAVEGIRDVSRDLTKKAKDLSDQFDKCLVATRAYVEHSSLPGQIGEERVESVGGER